MQWEIEFELIGKTDGGEKEKARLKERGLDGWEPYAVSGVTYHFKRPIKDPVALPVTDKKEPTETRKVGAEFSDNPLPDFKQAPAQQKHRR